MKQQLDSLLAKHYNKLLEVSSNITKRQGTDSSQRYNLLHETIICLYQRLDKCNDYLKSDTDFLKYVTHFLKQFYTWRKKDIYRLKVDNSLFSFKPYIETGNEDYDEEYRINNVIDITAEQQIYIEAENTTDLTKLFLKDLCSNDLTVEQGLNLRYMYKFISDTARNVLNDFEYDIFDCFYLQEMNCLMIHKMYSNENKDISYKKILATQKAVKQKMIDNLKWN